MVIMKIVAWFYHYTVSFNYYINVNHVTNDYSKSVSTYCTNWLYCITKDTEVYPISKGYVKKVTNGCIVLQEILKFIILVRVRLRKLNRIGYTEKQLL